MSHQDSNLGKQNQNLMCYHYTMGQSKLKIENLKFKIIKLVSISSFPDSESGCKSTNFSLNGQKIFAKLSREEGKLLLPWILRKINFL